MIEFSRDLSKIWVSGEYETKLSLQKLLFPEGIVIDPEDRTYRTSNLNPIIVIYLKGKRHRYWNGKAIGINLKSNDNPTLHKAAFELKLREGWRPKSKKKEVKEVPLTVIQALKQGVEVKIAQGCSDRFIKDAKRIVILWKRYESEQNLKNLTLDKLQP